MKTHLFSSQLLKRGEMAIILIVIALVVAAVSAYLGSRYNTPFTNIHISLPGSHTLEKSR